MCPFESKKVTLKSKRWERRGGANIRVFFSIYQLFIHIQMFTISGLINLYLDFDIILGFHSDSINSKVTRDVYIREQIMIQASN